MSSAERFVRHHKRQVDCAISQAYVRLRMDACARSRFADLLHCVRSHAPRFHEARVENGRHPAIEGLVNLARFGQAHLRPAGGWAGSTGSWHAVIASLAQHLLGRYPVPPFLASAWYADDQFAERKRGWYVAHANGATFRSLDLPIKMTRKMEDIFLHSHDHLPVECAIRRAQLLALGASDDLLRAVLATPLAAEIDDAQRWEPVWMFLIANACRLEATQVGPLVDFIRARPSFSVRGRTLNSVLRLMREWHRGLGIAHGGVGWGASPLRPMSIEQPSDEASAPAAMWDVVELTDPAQLRIEGGALHHCVASYAERCRRGTSRIWSIRLRRADKVRHCLTIEVDIRRRAIVQARGWRNRSPAGMPLRLLREWARREKLYIA